MTPLPGIQSTFGELRPSSGHALTIAALALVLSPIYSMAQSLATTVRVGSVLLILFEVADMLKNRHPDPAIWSPAYTWKVNMAGGSFYISLQVVNLWLASLGLLQLGYLLLLASPAGIFYNFVRNSAGPAKPHRRALKVLGRDASAGALNPRAVVLVEGMSDQAAVETLAHRRGRDLVAENVAVVAMGGATNLWHFLERFGPRGIDVRLAGLCDAAEEYGFRRGLERAGLGSNITRSDMEDLGFYVCEADLEDELIRALGTSAVEAIIETQRESVAFRSFQRQPAQRGRPLEAQLRRFMGTLSGRKIRYGHLMVEALDISRVPPPLDGVLDRV